MVIPGCSSPENLTKTLSGISNGITPRVAAKATIPEPAGKLIPIGNLVWLSPPVPTVSGSSILFNHECIIPSPGLSETPPLFIKKSGNVL